MLKTSNYNLNKLETNDIVDFDVLNENADILDTELRKVSDKANYIQIAAGSATAITLSNVTLANGFTVSFVVAANNNGAATTINGKALYKPGGTVAPKLIAGRAVTVWYNGTHFFIKASATGTVVAANVLAPYTFSNDEDIDIVGTMPNQSGKPLSIANHAANMTVVVDAGDNRMGVIDLPNQYPVTGYVDANTHFLAQLWGLIPENIRYGANVGQYPGYGTGNMAGSFTGDADAVAGDMISGKAAYVKGAKVTGNIPVVNPDYSDQLPAVDISVGAYTGDGLNYAYLNHGLNGKYSNGANWVRRYEPYLRPEYILDNATIMGVHGTAKAGKRFATGTVTSSGASAGTFYDGATYERLRPYVSVSGLTFTPSRIIVMSYGSDFTYVTMYDSNGVITGNDVKIAVMTCKPFYENGQGHLGTFKMSGTAYVSGTGFALPCVRASGAHTWFAYE